jgi:hypothetical protein
MPKYSIIHAEQLRVADEGEELADGHAAWREATMMAGEIIRDIDGKLRPGQCWELEVIDEFRNPLYVISVRARKG